MLTLGLEFQEILIKKKNLMFEEDLKVEGQSGRGRGERKREIFDLLIQGRERA